MAGLREIKKRMNSVATTEQITRTMEMVSSAKISRALSRAEKSEAYRRAIEDVMYTVAGDVRGSGGDGVSSRLLYDPQRYERALVIAVSSDRGLAGGFNSSVARATEARIEHFLRHGAKEVELICCGRKAAEHFRRYPHLVMSYVGESDAPDYEQCKAIADYVLKAWDERRIGRADIIYYHARNRVEQTLRQERILPLSHETISEPRGPRTDKRKPRRLSSPFEFSPSAGHVLGNLFPSYVLTVIHQALIDSAAAEHAARRRAMHSATENAGEIIDSLNRTYNNVRQASITTEINEIVGGANALEDN